MYIEDGGDSIQMTAHLSPRLKRTELLLLPVAIDMQVCKTK